MWLWLMGAQFKEPGADAIAAGSSYLALLGMLGVQPRL